ncbi:MAG: acylphosphatase [Gemmatimonadaceae bacterium]|nr:acylphosphatase [Gemmatimonadaceae bacterium]
MSASRFVVHGVVQGVGFRYFVRREATALGLSGWVRNLPDGSVEVLADGSDGALVALASRLQQGPPASQVREVARAPVVRDEILPTPFEVRR